MSTTVFNSFTGPESITLEEARDACSVLSADDDVRLSACIPAARQTVQNFTNMLYGTQTGTIYYDGFPKTFSFELPWGNITSISSVSYYDTAGTLQDLLIQNPDWLQIDLNGLPHRIALGPSYGFWPLTKMYKLSAVSIGFAGGVVMPAPVKSAALLVLSHLFNNKDWVVGDSAPVVVPETVDLLLANYRLYKADA